jgi:hypothetical protein
MQKTIIKTAETIQPGDIFRTEYGDYDNWVSFVFVACRPYRLNSTEIDVHYINSEAVFKVYDTDPINKIKFEVIGNENTDNCE